MSGPAPKVVSPMASINMYSIPWNTLWQPYSIPWNTIWHPYRIHSNGKFRLYCIPQSTVWNPYCIPWNTILQYVHVYIISTVLVQINLRIPNQFERVLELNDWNCTFSCLCFYLLLYFFIIPLSAFIPRLIDFTVSFSTVCTQYPRLRREGMVVLKEDEGDVMEKHISGV